jgi:hypothetical protein
VPRMHMYARAYSVGFESAGYDDLDNLPTPDPHINVVPKCRDTPPEANMTPRIPENVLTWLVDVGFVIVIGDMLPPRDPNDDDDEDEEDEEDEDREEEPAVIREPDE